MYYFNTFSLSTTSTLYKLRKISSWALYCKFLLSLCEIQRCIIRVQIFKMEPSESVPAFNLESRRWKVTEERGKNERDEGVGDEINSPRTKAHEPFQLLLRVLPSKGTFKGSGWGTPQGYHGEYGGGIL
ncbi:hypothetical protein CDAR_434341 [Caerostris darwini]|uniref:Uncharacterized protein n=1 Tax=Caerostris darwini TaxID=1538125 RepID=A0AAV4UA70_9ARAC|nr:hypothetical protein CDAR_434341 [Caerostris darwini]